MGDRLPQSYFDGLYRDDPDPWKFATSPYESAKYARTLATLTRPAYTRALEVGCSIGVFTRSLACRCASVLAVDIAPLALEQARGRCADLPHVRFEHADLTRAVPPGPFDLVTLSEVAYYWSRPVMIATLGAVIGGLAPGGELLLVHWTPMVPGYLQTGDEVHEGVSGLAEARGLARASGVREKSYRIDLFRRPDSAASQVSENLAQ